MLCIRTALLRFLLVLFLILLFRLLLAVPWRLRSNRVYGHLLYREVELRELVESRVPLITLIVLLDRSLTVPVQLGESLQLCLSETIRGFQRVIPLFLDLRCSFCPVINHALDEIYVHAKTHV